MRRPAIVFLSVLALGCISCSGDKCPDEVTFTKAELLDKIKGGWAGQAIGCTYGGPTEFKWKGTFVQDYVPIRWEEGYMKRMFTNAPGLYDDIYMDLTFVEVFDRLGLDAPVDSFAVAFANAGYTLWHANQAARYNILHGIMPPESGHWLNNPHADDIDYQIEADYAGLMSPAMPNTASEISDKIGHIMNYGDGWYGGVFVGAMYSLAFVYDDIETVVTEALRTIPEESLFHQCIADVIKWHREFPDDWKQCWFECQKNYSEDVGCPEGAFNAYDIDATINSAYIVIGLLYGNGDFEKTMDISTRCGQDSDCNPASAAGVLGAMIGYSNIPEKFLTNLQEAEDIDFAFTHSSMNKTYAMSMDHALRNIARNGGKVSDSTVVIAVQKPEPVVYEKSFENMYPIRRGNVDRFIEDELTIQFDGTGYVQMGSINTEDESYCAEIEVYENGKLLKTMDLPKSFTKRCQELFWLYGLNSSHHVLKLKWTNPRPDVKLHVAAFVAYDSKPETVMNENNVKDILAKMTVEEKVRTVVGTNLGSVTPPDCPPQAFSRTMAMYESLAQPTLSKVQGAAGDGYPVSRLGIPPLTYADGPAGLRISPTRRNQSGEYYCTAFPTGSMLAATWDREAVRRVGEAIGNEVHEYGCDVLLAPGMNIQRNPLCGRNFEYYSEDPILAGRTAAAYVSGVQSQGVGACVKHFAANNQEKFRNGINEIISQRALREIYLRGFEIAVKEAEPWTVMSSYNKVNGTFASENKWLLTDVLRDEWGFKGFVMTDWWAMELPVEQMKAGNDLLMPGYPAQIDELMAAVESGELPMETLDRNVERILNVIAKSPASKGYQYSNKPDLGAHAEVAREIAREGLVLLENKDNTLPLKAGQSVALLGVSAYDTQPGGSGSGYVNRKYKVTISDGLENAGFKIDGSLKERYDSHIADFKASVPAEYFWRIPFAPELSFSREEIKALAASNGMAVIVLGRMAGEGGDRTYTEGDYLLSKEEKDLLDICCEEFHAAGGKVCVILNMGSALEMDGWQNTPDALLMAWMPGQEGGNAIADVLGGTVSPSGKLPISIAAHYTDIPASRNFGLSEGEINTVRYEEDLMVGYRYFASSDVKPAYPFGFGLSYTTFEYSDFKLAKSGNGVTRLTVKVKNTGSCAGREAVQIYVDKPDATPDRPALELCGYTKTGTIEAGKSETVTIEIPDTDLAQFDPETEKLACVPGEYRLFAAASSDDIRAEIKINK